MPYRWDPIGQTAVWEEPPPPKPAPAKAPMTAARKGTLVALVGASAAAILATIVPQFEGTRLIGYRDPVGIRKRGQQALGGLT